MLSVAQSIRARKVKTKIVNATSHVLVVRQSIVNVHLARAEVPPKQECIIREDLDELVDHDYVLEVENQSSVIYSSVLFEAAEIRVYESPGQKVEWRASKLRRSRSQQAELNFTELAAFDAVIKDASSRMENIGKSQAKLVALSKEVKICPAQCCNLVQTCLDGGKEIKEAYIEKSEDQMWHLYSTNKLGQLINSLDKLLSALGSIHDLLQACGSNWYSMALDVSLPSPSPGRMSSKFDILLKEFRWNLETIQYALQWNRRVEFRWNDRKVRYVLETIAWASVAVAEDMELEESRRLASEDREHLLFQLENGSILAPWNPLLFGFKFTTDFGREKLATQLQQRLKEPVVLSSTYSSILDCFGIDIADLKLRNQLSANSTCRSVWKGEWCGQAVAVGVTKYTSEAAAEKEAGLMLKVQHPNIVGFLGWAFTDDAPPPVLRGRDEKCSAGYVVMELMKENLRHLIDRRARSHPGSPFSLAVTVDILSQIAAAMVHMHKIDVMHRDLKSDNCLVNPRSSSNSSPPVLKLIDFELSKELDPNAPISNHTIRQGTARWMAPEVWGGQNSHANSLERPRYAPYTRSADVWSFGMTCYEVITGKRPFYECSMNSEIENALRDGRRPVIPASVSCPEGLKALMSSCWAQEPSTDQISRTLRKCCGPSSISQKYNNTKTLQAQEPSLEA